MFKLFPDSGPLLIVEGRIHQGLNSWEMAISNELEEMSMFGDYRKKSDNRELRFQVTPWSTRL